MNSFVKALSATLLVVIAAATTAMAEIAFDARLDYHPQGQIADVTLADLDGDGDLDLITANYFKNFWCGCAAEIRTQLNHGDGTFAIPLTISAPESPTKLAPSDLDNDGDIDLAVATTESLCVYMNPGGGVFDTYTAYDGNYGQVDLSVADFDGDGYNDVAVINTGSRHYPDFDSGGVSIYRNAGDGSLLPRIDYDSLHNPRRLSHGDIDHDGDVDLVILGGDLMNQYIPTDSGLVCFMFNDGGGLFETDSLMLPGCNISNLTCADMNGDEFLDLITTDYGTSNIPIDSGDVRVFLAGGDGTFKQTAVFETGYHPGILTTADFNDDGWPDLGVATWDSLVVYINDGSGTLSFSSSLPVNLYTYAFATGDISGDGRCDLVLESGMGGFPESCDGFDLEMLIGTGSGTFHSSGYYPTLWARTLCCGDFDNDGDPDLATIHYNYGDSNNLAILTNAGDGTIGGETYYDLGYMTDYRLSAPATADFDGDGALDLAISGAGSDVLLLLNNGNGIFPLPVPYLAGPYLGPIAAADFNGDDAPDIVVASVYTATLWILVNNGDGTMQTAVSLSMDGEPGAVACSDVDGDGDTDIVAVGEDMSALTVFVNDGTGSFSMTNSHEVGFGACALVVADLDSDGDVDLALANEYTGDLIILRNPGNGIYETIPISVGMYIPEAITTSDFDADGDLDLAVSGYGVWLLENTGSCLFETVVSYGTPHAPGIVATDLNRDGAIDLALVCDGGGATECYPYGQVGFLFNTVSCCRERGDCDGDGNTNIADVTYLVEYLFRGGPEAPCPPHANLDGIGQTNISDLTYLIDYLFRGGPLPVSCP